MQRMVCAFLGFSYNSTAAMYVRTEQPHQGDKILIVKQSCRPAI